MTTEDLAKRFKRAALVYARSFVPVASRPPSPHRWDGKSLAAVPHMDRFRSPEPLEWAACLIHDTNHWRVAPPSRRIRPEFGLGRPLYVPAGRPLQRRVGADYANHEEALVTVLDMVVFLKLGMRRKQVRRWASELLCPDTAPEVAAEVVRRFPRMEKEIRRAVLVMGDIDSRDVDWSAHALLEAKEDPWIALI